MNVPTQQNGTKIVNGDVSVIDEKTMERIQRVADISGFIVEWCASFAVAGLIKQNVHPSNRRQRIYIYVGGYAVGSLIGMKAGEHVSKNVYKVLVGFAAQPDIKKST